MRQIRFRGYCEETCNWVYGSLYNGLEWADFIIRNLQHFEDRARVITDSIGQFTGLHDKNGKEIYEGDVVKGNHKDLFIIEELNGGLQMYNLCYHSQRHNELIASPTCDSQTKSWLEDAEVVGNLFENPELLQNTSKGMN